jgi:hypothetical protein
VIKRTKKGHLIRDNLSADTRPETLVLTSPELEKPNAAQIRQLENRLRRVPNRSQIRFGKKKHREASSIETP